MVTRLSSELRVTRGIASSTALLGSGIRSSRDGSPAHELLDSAGLNQSRITLGCRGGGHLVSVTGSQVADAGRKIGKEGIDIVMMVFQSSEFSPGLSTLPAVSPSSVAFSHASHTTRM